MEYRAAHIERIEYAKTHLVGVGHRQDRQPSVLLVGLLCVPGLDDILAEIPVAQHYALCLS